MFAYANDIAAHVCPDKKNEVMFCVRKASSNTIDFEKVNVPVVKQRYCQAKAECATRKIACEKQRAEDTRLTCECMRKMKLAASSCEHPPSPCDLQADPPRIQPSGDVCESSIPTASEMIEIVRARNGGSKEKIAAAQAAKGVTTAPRKG